MKEQPPICVEAGTELGQLLREGRSYDALRRYQQLTGRSFDDGLAWLRSVARSIADERLRKAVMGMRA